MSRSWRWCGGSPTGAARGSKSLNREAFVDLMRGNPKPQFVAEQARRLGLEFRSAEEVQAFLAVTRFDSLQVVRDGILNASGDGMGGSATKYAAEFTSVLAKMKAPELAPHMLKLKLESKAPKPAHDWLVENPAYAIAGLVPIVAQRGKLADAAIEHLREAKSRGHEPLIREAAKAAGNDAAERVRIEVLEHVERAFEPLDEKSMPKALKAALADAASLKVPPWPEAARARPILIGDNRLSVLHTGTVLAALAASTLEAPLAVCGTERACHARVAGRVRVGAFRSLAHGRGAAQEQMGAQLHRLSGLRCCCAKADAAGAGLAGREPAPARDVGPGMPPRDRHRHRPDAASTASPRS